MTTNKLLLSNDKVFKTVQHLYVLPKLVRKHSNVGHDESLVSVTRLFYLERAKNVALFFAYTNISERQRTFRSSISKTVKNNKPYATN